MAQRKKQSLLNGALILSFAIIAVKIIGVFFKLYVTLKIGYTGKGYYATAYNIYTPIYSIALAGLPTAVSKIVASKAAQGRYKDVKNLFWVSRQLFFLMGIVGTVIMLLIAYPFTKSISSFDSLPSILVIAPSLFFCCVMSGYRGYYQGLRDMVPSAVSQIFEAAGKLIFGWVLINAVLASGAGFAGKIPGLKNIVTDNVQSYASAAAIAGVTIGTVMAFIYLILRHKIAGDGITPELLAASPRADSFASLRVQLIRLAIPIAISALVFNITTLIDNWTIQNRLQYVLDNNYDIIANMYSGIVSARGFTADMAESFKSYLYGAYDTVLEIKNIVPTFTVTLGLSAIPVLSEAWTRKKMKSVKRSIESVIRITMLVAFPAGCGMIALSDDILYLLYGTSEANAPAIPYIAPILAAYGFSAFFLALMQPITNMLQAVDRTDVPIKAMAIGATVKIIANFTLVSIPSINIQGAVVGSILCNIVIVVYGLAVLAKVTRLRFNYLSIFIKPFICAVISGAAAWAANGIFEKLLPAGNTDGFVNGQNLAALIGVVAAVLVYAAVLLLSRTLSKSDIRMLPKGEKIAKVLEKYRLIG